MIILIDNYDSFTYNLFQYIGEINPDIEVFRNDKITVAEVLAHKPSHIIISPGPKTPDDAGIVLDLIKENTQIPMLGICLGMQSMCQTFGGRVVKAPYLVHGKSCEVTIDNDSPLFVNMPKKISVGRYHSLIAERESLSSDLQIIAETADKLIMGVKHKTRPIYGIQFHPESILTPNGKTILQNFLAL